MRLLTAPTVLDSPARATGARAARRPPFPVGAVQVGWLADPIEHARQLETGVALVAAGGARLVCLPELTLSAYFAADSGGPGHIEERPESIHDGPTRRFAAELAARYRISVHASLWEADDRIAPRGWNTAICVAPDGTLVARTRKLHIPITKGYEEDRYFPPGDTGYPVVEIASGAPAEADRVTARFGFPTCWDQWFPEVARAYSLAGAEVLVYSTAIGSEPDHPRLDTQPLWRNVIVANGITNATFMVAVNRVGTERLPGASAITFYGSSFISDPYGRVLVEAPRDEPVALIADLDLDQRGDWLALFPFLDTRRPDTYAPLVAPNAWRRDRGRGERDVRG